MENGVTEYIDVQGMADMIKDICAESRDKFGSTASECSFVQSEFDDDWLEEYSYDKALGLNREMRRYLHLKEHHIGGNFNNIDMDYPAKIDQERGVPVSWCSDRGLVDDLTRRLDGQDDSQRTQGDRKWLNGWVFETFGAFGIRYEFESLMSESLYCHEEALAE